MLVQENLENSAKVKNFSPKYLKISENIKSWTKASKNAMVAHKNSLKNRQKCKVFSLATDVGCLHAA